jgi:hypothetical protein
MWSTILLPFSKRFFTLYHELSRIATENFEKGNDQLFLCLKEKVAKRSKQPCRLIRFAESHCGSVMLGI